ncbi:putative vesicle-associated membrane protein [Trypanosoma vivax]|nr:putative vesicle-associated membrane protein [Trypanosoma vivax]
MAMTILAAFISMDHKVVISYRVTAQMMFTISPMLERLPQYDAKISFQYQSNAYHFLVENEIVYCCISKLEYMNYVVFGYLMEVHNAFKVFFTGCIRKYPQLADMEPCMCTKFSSTLAELTCSFNSHVVDKLDEIDAQINEAKQIIQENLDMLLDCGDRVENICLKTESFQSDANCFCRNSRGVSFSMIKKNLRIIVGVLCLLCFVLCVVFMPHK